MIADTLVERASHCACPEYCWSYGFYFTGPERGSSFYSSHEITISVLDKIIVAIWYSADKILRRK